MARFEVQAPDGTTYQIEAPDQAAAMAAIQAIMGGNRKTARDEAMATMRERSKAAGGLAGAEARAAEMDAQATRAIRDSRGWATGSSTTCWARMTACNRPARPWAPG